MRIVNEAGLRLIKSFESCRLTSYADVGGKPTIGWGHTHGVLLGQHICQDQADSFLLEDLALAEADVQTLIKVPLTDNQFSALVSLRFNCGRAPLTTTLGQALNRGAYGGAADMFLRWDMVGPNVVPGLADRRAAERALFLRPDNA